MYIYLQKNCCELTSSELTSSNYFLQTDRQKAMHKSPLCSGTGGLKKLKTIAPDYVITCKNVSPKIHK